MKPGTYFADEGPWVVVTGQVGDGFEFTGPFTSYDTACEWAGGLAEASSVERLHLPNPETQEDK